MNDTYYLMHEDIQVVKFNIMDGSVSCIEFIDCKNSLQFIPCGIVDNASFKRWLLERGIQTSRDGINDVLSALDISSVFEFMLLNKGVSLYDHYWVSDNVFDYGWGCISPYINNFKSVYTLDLQSDFDCSKVWLNPSTSLRGDLKKKWIIDQNGVRLLVKGNYNNTCRQSIGEVFATEIHKRQQKFSYVPYTLIKISSDGQSILGCSCPNFTTIDTEFIPAISVIDTVKKPNNISYYELYVNLCLQHGIDVRAFLEYQIMSDFIISNTDRHLNNFGVIRDSHTLQWLSPAPIFDSGNSLFYKSHYIPVDKGLLKLEVSSFASKEVNLLRYVTNRGLLDVRLLPDDNFLYNLLKLDINTRDEVNERIIKAYRRKIKYLVDFQNGADIWSYNYKG